MKKMDSVDEYVDKQSLRKGMKKLPVSESFTPVQINDTKHACKWVKEKKQTHPHTYLLCLQSS